MPQNSKVLRSARVEEKGKIVPQRSTPRRLVITSIMIALGASLSIYPGSIPIGPTRVFPFQHMINGITGVVLGPLNAMVIATGIAVLRMLLGTGTIFAFVGGIPGAIIVGVIYHYIKRSDAAALAEPIGTTIGALLSAFLVAPAIGTNAFPPFLGLTAQWEIFSIFFLMSSIPGTLLGFTVLLALRRSGLLARLLP